MDPTRFDAIARLFATLRTRRAAVTGGLGVAAATTWSHDAARQGTPQVATPIADSADPHPSADTAAAAEFLFVQPFDSGSWAPKACEDGMFTLTLTGAAAQTIYFSDRPERIVGITPTQQFLDELGFTPANPPNAAIVAQREDGTEQEILVIELLNPVYDAEAGMLTYDARVLADYGEHGLAHLARQQQDYELGETFGAGSLFIDNCTPETWQCALEQSGQKVVVGYVQACIDAYAPAICAQEFPDQCANDGCDAYCCY